MPLQPQIQNNLQITEKALVFKNAFITMIENANQIMTKKESEEFKKKIKSFHDQQYLSTNLTPWLNEHLLIYVMCLAKDFNRKTILKIYKIQTHSNFVQEYYEYIQTIIQPDCSLLIYIDPTNMRYTPMCTVKDILDANLSNITKSKLNTPTLYEPYLQDTVINILSSNTCLSEVLTTPDTIDIPKQRTYLPNTYNQIENKLSTLSPFEKGYLMGKNNRIVQFLIQINFTKMKDLKVIVNNKQIF